MRGNPILFLLVLWPMAGGVLSFLAGRISKRLRDYAADAVTLAELGIALHCFSFLGDREASWFFLGEFCSFGIHLTLDGFRLVYAVVIAYMWCAATIFSREYLAHYRNRNRYHLFVLLTLGSIMGVFLSSDLYTTFVFFEMMSLFSCIMVIQDETPSALRAAETYLAVAIVGGLVTLAGLVFLKHQTGTLDMEALEAAGALTFNKQGLYLAGVLIFVGFGAKAAVFPLHVWLPTAHPAAPAPSSALLSGVLTKSGLFGVLVLSTGIFLHNAVWGLFLLSLGVLTMVIGALLALFSVNLKRVLACSSMSQIGFILTGIAMQCFLGPDNDLAVRGTMIYMVGHSLIKLVLFMVSGVVTMNTGKLDLNDIRGYGRGKPLLLYCFLMGALGLAGFPLWNGYIGKTLLHESIVEHIHHLASPQTTGAMSELLYSGLFNTSSETALFQAVEWVFLMSGGLTAAYVLKLFSALFLAEPPQRHSRSKRDYVSPVNALVLAASATLLPLLGLFPRQLADPVGTLGAPFMRGPAESHLVHYFSLGNLKGAAVSLGLGLWAYFFIVRRFLMKTEPEGRPRWLDLWPGWLSLENSLYRPLLGRALPFILALCARLLDLVAAGPVRWALSRATTKKFVMQPEDHEFGIYPGRPPEPTFTALLSSTFAYGMMAFAVGVLFLMAYLFL